MHLESGSASSHRWPLLLQGTLGIARTTRIAANRLLSYVTSQSGGRPCLESMRTARAFLSNCLLTSCTTSAIRGRLCAESDYQSVKNHHRNWGMCKYGENRTHMRPAGTSRWGKAPESASVLCVPRNAAEWHRYRTVCR